MLRIASHASLIFLVFTGVASAQQGPPPDGYEEDPNYDETDPAYEEDPNYDETAAPEEPPPQGQEPTYDDDGSIRVVEQGSPEAEAMTAEEGRGLEAGGHLLIPFYADRPELNPGIGVQGRFGWEFPHGFTVELNLGVQSNRFKEFDRNLLAFWIGGGARYSFLNRSAFVPFVGLNLQVSFWQDCIFEGGVCTDELNGAGLGVTPLAGVAWELGPRVGLEFGLQATMTFFADDNELVVFGNARTVEAYLSPFLGGTFYF
ncbi:MAG: hypothetical protein ACOCXM_08920 [Myxococcota bacterium]